MYPPSSPVMDPSRFVSHPLTPGDQTGHVLVERATGLELLGDLVRVGRWERADERRALHGDRQGLLQGAVEGGIAGLVEEVRDQDPDRLALTNRPPQRRKPPSPAHEHHQQGGDRGHESAGQHPLDREGVAFGIEAIQRIFQLGGCLEPSLGVGIEDSG